MSKILGYDAVGRPLRAGDEVILVRATNRKYLGLRCSIIGPADRLGYVETDYPSPWPFDGNAVGLPEWFRKADEDFQPADMTFDEMMRSLKGQEVSA